MTRTEAKDYILHHLEQYPAIRPAKKKGTYICPLCGNGSGSTGDGLEQDKKDGTGTHWKCFKCGFYGDAVELVAQVEGIQDGGSREAFEAAYRAYGLTVEPDHQQEPRKQEQQSRPAAAPKDYTEQYKAWHNSLLQAENALAYLESRGITRETADRFMLGYVVDQYNTPRIVIPRSRHDYTARRIDGGTKDKYMVTGRQGVLFNAKEAMKDKGDKAPVVVVEGEFDAMSIYQGGYTAVIALGYAGAYKALVERAKATYPAATYILALDNDGEENGHAGQTAQSRAQAAMEAAGLHCIAADPARLYGESKDAAEAIQRDTGGFFERLTEYLDQGYYERQRREQEAEQEAYFKSGPGAVDLFLQVIKGERYRPISTGISCIDAALCGGLVRQTIVLLGAAPGMGKTSLAAQIGENLAKDGHDILFINLEMSREQLLSRSLARIANRRGHHISTNDILRGYKWTIDTEEAVYEAADEYKQTVAQHLLYNPGQETTDLDEIMKKIQDEQARIGHAPIVFLDYLQLLTGKVKDRDEEPVQTIKRAMQTLKGYAIANNTIVFLITANNRESMKSGDSDLNSSRDTSNIEYGADMHLGLVYKALEEPEQGGPKDIKELRSMKSRYYDAPQDPQAARDFKKYCCEFSLKVNKNRHGSEGRRAYLYFDGASATFTPLETQQPEPPGMEGARAYRYNTSSSGPEWEDMELLP